MKKAISIILSLVMIFTLCMPTFGAYATQESAVNYHNIYSSDTSSATNSYFTGNDYVNLTTVDTEQVLQLSYNQDPSKRGTEAAASEKATFSAQDWTGYEYINFEVKKTATEATSFALYIYTGSGAKLSWYKLEIPVTESGWDVVSVKLSEFGNLGVLNAMTAIDGLRLTRVAGEFQLKNIWLSKTAVSASDLSITDISMDDGTQDVSTNLKSIDITYNQDLIEADYTSQVSMYNLTAGLKLESGFQATVSGNKLQVLFDQALEPGVRYRLEIGKGIASASAPYAQSGASVTFTTEAGGAVVVNDVDIIKERWKKSLVGDESNDTSKAHVAAYINAIDTACRSSFNGMTRDALWYSKLAASSHLTHCFEQVERMAKGYVAKGSIYQNNEEVLEKIKYALDWLFDNYYSLDMALLDRSNPNDLHWTKNTTIGFTEKNDWYDWFIASPRSIVNTFILLEGHLDDELVDRGLDVIELFLPSMENFQYDSLFADRGSNLIYYMKIRVGTTLLRDDTPGLREFLNELVPEFDYVSGENQGFHADGTYLYHNNHFLNGTYGAEHFELLPEIAALVKDTAFALESDLVANLLEIYYNAFEPLIYDGKVAHIATGRAPYDLIYDSALPKIMKSSLNLVTLLEGNSEYINECEPIKQRIKEYYSTNTTNLNALPIELSEKAYDIVNDSSISDSDHYTGTKIYPDGDKAVHHTDSFMTAISMSSSRVYNYESLHDGYTKGWYMGDGMQYTYMSGDSQYNKSWFTGSDPYKRPGTTVDTQERIAAKITGGEEYLSSKDFVGGVSLGNIGVAAMDLESYHNDDTDDTDVIISGAGAGDAPSHDCSLTAKKSWFMFDDEVVSLGTDIDANDGYEVLTVVDNRAPSNGSIYVNGTSADASTKSTHNSVSHLNYGGTIGYVFPDTENVTLNTKGSYIESWISHDVSPTDADYAYITLPCTTNAETSAYASAPDATILSNTSSVQAVKDNSTNTTGYVFWQAATFDGISAANPCTVVKKEADGLVTMAVSDPTHKLDSITLTLNGIVVIPQGTPDNITFEEADGNTVITIDSSANTGEGYEFSYRLQPKVEVESIKLSADDANVNATFTIVNPLDRDVNLTVYLALYNSEGKFLKVISKGVTVPAASTGSDSISLPDEGACVAKAFVMKDYVPVGSAAVLQCTQ